MFQLNNEDENNKADELIVSNENSKIDETVVNYENNKENEVVIDSNVDSTVIENTEQKNVETDKVQVERNDKNKKKKLSRKAKIIIFLIIFVIISIAVTVISIYYTNKGLDIKKDILKIGTNINEEDLVVKSLTERYKLNNITIENVDIEEGKEITLFENSKSKEIYINYPIIDGLLNKSIEDKINNEIKDKTFEYKKYITNGEYKVIYIYTYVTANYSDVLSVHINAYGIPKNSNKYEYNNIPMVGLNYRLDTGEKIKFNDLFVKGSNINALIAEAKYKFLAKQEINEPSTIDMKKIDTSKYEDEVFSTVLKYKDNNDIVFSFTPSYIQALVNGEKELITIDMVDSENGYVEDENNNTYKNIAIYKRFKSDDNLYTSTKILSPFVFTTKSYSNINKYTNNNELYMYDNVLDNLFVDCDIGYNKNPEFLKTKIDEKILEVKKIATDDKSKGILCKMFANLYFNEKEQIYHLSFYYSINTMSINYYTNNAFSLVAESERRPKYSMEDTYFVNYLPDYKGKSKLYNNKNVDVKSYNYEEKFDINGNVYKEPQNNNNTVNIYGNS